MSLNVAQQTTSSLRTLFGLDLAGAVLLGTERTLDLALRLGWQHGFVSSARPITAALSGAPFAAFTVYGATPQPDAAVVSLRAATTVAAGAQLYLRYAPSPLACGSAFERSQQLTPTMNVLTFF